MQKNANDLAIIIAETKRKSKKHEFLRTKRDLYLQRRRNRAKRAGISLTKWDFQIAKKTVQIKMGLMFYNSS